MADTKIDFAGDVDFRSCLITSQNGTELDIINMINSVEIYESLESPFLTVDLFISDAIGLEGKFPIIGEEIVTLDLRGPDGETGLINKPFFVYKLTERIPDTDRNFLYILHLISVEAVIDLNLKVSRSFKGQPSDLIKYVVNGEILGSEKPLVVEPTKSAVQFISNYWSPIKIIRFLCDRAVAKASNSPTFMFYETKKGFYFVSQDALVASESSCKFVYSNRKDNDIAASMERIQKLYVDVAFDYIDRVSSGMYGNRLLTVNPMTKSYKYTYLDFAESFNRFSRMNELAIASDKATRRINSVLNFRETPSGAFKGMPIEKATEWLQPKITEMSTRDAQKIQIDVPGRFNIYVGNMTDVMLYSESMPNDPAVEKDLRSILDRVYSGRYMVHSIRHKINRDSHTMNLELHKDSMVKLS